MKKIIKDRFSLRKKKDPELGWVYEHKFQKRSLVKDEDELIVVFEEIKNWADARMNELIELKTTNS